MQTNDLTLLRATLLNVARRNDSSVSDTLAELVAYCMMCQDFDPTHVNGIELRKAIDAECVKFER